MKKVILGLVFGLMLVPVARAATLSTEGNDNFQQNSSQVINPVTITATTDNEITRANGIDLLLNDCQQMLWDDHSPLTSYGLQTQQGKVDNPFVPEYRNNYLTLHIPVVADFKAGESVTISDLRVRTYKTPFAGQCLQLDVNGDGVPDARTNWSFVVANAPSIDNTPPYPPTHFTATLSDDRTKVQLSWVAPPDFDVSGFSLQRKVVRAGQNRQGTMLDNINVTSLTDKDVQAGDQLTYTLYAFDGYNSSDLVTAVVNVPAATPPVATPPMTPTPVTTPVVTTPVTTPAPTQQTNETVKLSKLYNYYKIRYAIKCPEGVSPNDGACRWAKIDLVYAQTLLARSDLAVSLTTRDLQLIKTLIVWPEKRYQADCVEAATPDKTCPAQEDSIKRAHYFIDQK
jgi:hypothetical protein